MENVNLPTEKAFEPFEEARQPPKAMSPPLEHQSSKKLIYFADNTEHLEKLSSQRSYKDVLSQPAVGLSHRQKMLWLQKRRTSGLWIQCDNCDRWRFQSNILDRQELPRKWFCKMNTDPSIADCSIPEVPICVRDEEDLIYSEYSAGSVVWARLPGWPWWPAMVDDCPDTEEFYWLDGFSDIPTHYNVVFFDSTDATRAWIAPNNLKPYISNKHSLKLSKKENKYNKRLQVAMNQADDAVKLSLNERLAKYSFIARYKGVINSPKKITKKDLVKYRKSLKRKYDIEFPTELSSGEDEPEVVKEKPPMMNKNLILLGTPKKNKVARSVIDVNVKKVVINEGTNDQNTNTTETANTLRTDSFKEQNSMAVQVGSTVDTHGTESIDNDTSKTYVPVTETEETTEFESQQTQEFSARIPTPNSDDFDF